MCSSPVQLLKLRARFLWRVSLKHLLGRRFGLQNGRKLPGVLYSVQRSFA